MSGDTITPAFHPIFSDTGKGHSFNMLGTTMHFISTAADTGGKYTVAEQTTPPGWGPPRHMHSREDEIFYIIEGSYELHVGEERRTLLQQAARRSCPAGFPTAFATWL